MNVQVVGGAGYIGSHAAQALRNRGHNVLIYDNLSTGHSHLTSDFQLVLGDLANRQRLMPILAGMDAMDGRSACTILLYLRMENAYFSILQCRRHKGVWQQG